MRSANGAGRSERVAPEILDLWAEADSRDGVVAAGNGVLSSASLETGLCGGLAGVIASSVAGAETATAADTRTTDARVSDLPVFGVGGSFATLENNLPGVLSGGSPGTLSGGSPGTLTGGSPGTLSGGSPGTLTGSSPGTLTGGTQTALSGSSPSLQSADPNVLVGGSEYSGSSSGCAVANQDSNNDDAMLLSLVGAAVLSGGLNGQGGVNANPALSNLISAATGGAGNNHAGLVANSAPAKQNKASARAGYIVLWSFLAVACCFPTGFVSLVLAIAGTHYETKGNYGRSKKLLRWASILNIVSLIGGIFFLFYDMFADLLGQIWLLLLFD